jgi:hypothetical protein
MLSQGYLRSLFVCVAVFISSAAVHGAPVTTMFTAEVDQIVADNNNLSQIGGISLGDTLIGTMVFDPDFASADLDPDPDRGFFNHTLPSGLVLDYQIGGLSFPGGAFGSYTLENNISTTLSANSDVLFVASGSTGFPPNWNANQTFIDLAAADASGEVFSQNEGFITEFDFNDYDLARAAIFLNGNVNIDGQSFTNVFIGSTVQITVIPEPSSAVVLGSLYLIAGCGLRRKRRRKKRTTSPAGQPNPLIS